MTNWAPQFRTPTAATSPRRIGGHFEERHHDFNLSILLRSVQWLFSLQLPFFPNPSPTHLLPRASCVLPSQPLKHVSNHPLSRAKSARMPSPKSIAVIGAGASGLQALRWLQQTAGNTIDTHSRGSRLDSRNVVVFERNSEVGGTWIYSPKHNADVNDATQRHGEASVSATEDHTSSAIYASLRTNLPHELMSFSDFPFPSNISMFPRHEVVLDYLKSYAKHFNMEQHIRFNTSVKSVEFIERIESWRVVSEQHTTKTVTEEWFDAIVVATGHYYDPLVPSISGIDVFPGSYSSLYKASTCLLCTVY